MRRLPWTCLVFACLPAAALAGWNDQHASSLDWNRYDVNWEIGGASQATRVTTIGIEMVEPSGRWFYGGLRGGYVDVEQPGNPLTPGADLDGGYAGIILGIPFVDTEYFDFTAQYTYTYSKARDDITDAQKAEFAWYEGVLRVTVSGSYGPVRLSLGAYRQDVEGDLELSGTVNQTIEFTHSEEDGEFAGLEFRTDRDGGTIGVYAERGARESIMVSFSRKF